MKVLQKEDKEIRRDAAYALAKIGAEASSVVPVLIEALQDKERNTRYSAVEALALGNVGSEAKAAVPLLIAALKDDDSYLRNRAAEALGKIGSEAASTVPALIDVLKDEDESLRRNATEALGKIGRKRKQPFLPCWRRRCRKRRAPVPLQP
jgi:HEAT repeat protein